LLLCHTCDRCYKMGGMEPARPDGVGIGDSGRFSECSVAWKGFPMDRLFAARFGMLLFACGVVAGGGCRGNQTAKVLKPGAPDMVGSHTAGSETFKPLVEQAVGNLLARYGDPAMPVDPGIAPGPKRICFIGVENKSSEELGDFKEQIYQTIDTRILRSEAFAPISRRFVDAGLKECRLRPDEIFLPKNQQVFLQALQQAGQPFDCLLYATLTSGTTRSNKDYQRDYTLTLEMVDIRTGKYEKEAADLSKAYNVSVMAKVKNLNPLR
jgi:hypothetical protein